MFRTTRSLVRGTGIALLLAAAPVYSASAETNSPIAERYSELGPNEFVWRPQLADSGPIEVVVSLPQQLAFVYRGGTLIGMSTVSTGREGHETPTGSFEILQKRREHYSNLYEDAPMPFMQRLTWDGIALHGGHNPGHPASHGCIRLPMAFARHLYEATQLGASVHVINAQASPDTALTFARGGSAGSDVAFAAAD